MDAITISQLIKGLGHSYEALLAGGAVSNSAPEPLFQSGENIHFVQKPESGVELWFGLESKNLERIIFSLTAVAVGDVIYAGALPAPFIRGMSQTSIRAQFGEPVQSMGPKKFPSPIGMTGGWDAYLLGPVSHSRARFIAQYSPDKSVNTLVFTLHD